MTTIVLKAGDDTREVQRLVALAQAAADSAVGEVASVAGSVTAGIAAGVAAAVDAVEEVAEDVDASASAAAASAFQAATDRGLAQSTLAAINAAIAGYPGGSGLTIPAATRSALAAVSSPAGAAQLNEPGREGVFVWSSANLSANVTADPLQGIFVPPSSATSGASGAWVRIDKDLHPAMFGADGVGDDLPKVRAAAYWACVLKRPLRPDQDIAYRITGDIYMGSPNGSPPASGALDGFDMDGNWRFVTASSATTANLYFSDGKNAKIGDVDFDITTEATTGHGQIRVANFTGLHLGVLRKVGDAVTAATYGGQGGSVLSLQSGSKDIHFDGAIVEHAGPNASAVFSVGCDGLYGKLARCVGGQDALDLSGTTNWHVEVVEGEDVNEILDLGNAPRGSCGFVKGKNVAHGISFKTEVSGSFDLGTNDVEIGRMDIDEFTGSVFRMSGGVGTTQTLHGIHVGYISAKTTTATNGSDGTTAGGATCAIYTASGDVTADPSKGLTIDGGRIEMNTGVGISLSAMVDYSITLSIQGCATLVEERTPSSFTTKTNGLIELAGTGNITTLHRGLTIRRLRLAGGGLTVANPIGGRFEDIEIHDAPGDAFDIQFNSASSAIARKDVQVRGYRNKNNGVSGGTKYGLLVRQVGASAAIEDVHINGVVIIDDQGSPTSGGLNFGNATFDYCTLRGVTARGIVNQLSFGFLGLHSFNDPDNRLLDPIGAYSGGSFTVNAGYWFRDTVWTGSGTLTLPQASAGSTDWPMNSEMKVTNNSGGSNTIAAGSGATIIGPTSLANGKTATIRQGRVASTYIVEMSA